MIRNPRSIARLSLMALGLIAGILNAHNSYAATYYVGKSGNDDFACSTAQSKSRPKASISAGIGCLSAGDTLLVLSGTYSEMINTYNTSIPNGTSASAIVTIMANPGDTVTIQPPSGGVGSLLDLEGQHWITVKGFILDGRDQVSIVKIGYASTHIRFDGNEIKNATHNGFLVSDPGTNYIEIVNNDIHDNSHSVPRNEHGYGIYTGQANVLIEGNDIHHNARYGIHLYSQEGTLRYATIRNNRIHDNGVDEAGAGIMIGGKEHSVYNNLIYNNIGHGIQVDYSGPNFIRIFNNTIYNNTGYGLTMGAGSTVYNTTVKNNIVYKNGSGAILDQAAGTEMSNNLTTDPKFKDAPHDFRLSAGSPAVDAGANLTGTVDTDSDGISRPQGGAYDIGAFEYGTTRSAALPSAPKKLRLVP